jgi:hypothetical protein
MAMFACENCGKIEDIPPARIRCGRRYCSPKCKTAAATTRPTRTKVELPCLQCGKTFLCPQSWAREGRRKFCGRTCRDRHQRSIAGPAHPRYGVAHTPEAKAKTSRTKMERGSTLKREKHPHWKGGRMVNADGYVHLMIDVLPEHQRAMARQMRPNQGYIAEHRLVVATAVGRPLAPKEVVHHKNGIKTDNRPENLALMDWGNHSRKHRHVERELAAALAEIDRLKSLLKTFLPDGSNTSN